MEHGFIRVGAATPQVSVAEPAQNRCRIEELCREAEARQVKILVFPELCLTGYTCSDLFLQDTLLAAARKELAVLADHTKGYDLLIFVGLPWMRGGKLYNVMAARFLAWFPKRRFPTIRNFMRPGIFKAGTVCRPWKRWSWPAV